MIPGSGLAFLMLWLFIVAAPFSDRHGGESDYVPPRVPIPHATTRAAPPPPPEPPQH